MRIRNQERGIRNYLNMVKKCFNIKCHWLRYLMIAIAAIGFSMNLSAAETAEAILKKAATAIKNAGGLSASFSLTSGNHKLTGTMKSSATKFSLETSTTSTWYDGKTMWTYNGNTKETTVTIPAQSELAEANPLYIVNAYSNNFTASFSKSQSKGSKTIVLTPKSKKLGYKSVHITIPDKSSFPSQVVVIPQSGQRISISISQVKTGVKFTASTFVYPKSKYPKAEIVDLR